MNNQNQMNQIGAIRMEMESTLPATLENLQLHNCEERQCRNRLLGTAIQFHSKGLIETGVNRCYYDTGWRVRGSDQKSTLAIAGLWNARLLIVF